MHYCFSSVSATFLLLTALLSHITFVLADVTEAQQNLIEISSSLDEVVGELGMFSPTKTWNVDQAQVSSSPTVIRMCSKVAINNSERWGSTENTERQNL